MYECGTCGSNTLIARCTSRTWELSCGSGHVWIPVPGTEIVMDTSVVVADLTPLVTGKDN